MKKLTTLLAGLTLTFAAGAATPYADFEETAYDFGTIAEDGGNVTHEFKFTNSGDEPLMIVKATASCGCTKPTYPKKPIIPGKSDKIKVSYNPKGRPGEFVKSIIVKTNSSDKKNKTVKLLIKGFVTPQK